MDALLAKQHGVVASWQLLQLGWSQSRVREALRGWRRVYRGVCAIGDVTELGWYMAAALALGPTGAISHRSAAMLLGLRPSVPGPIHVSFTGGGRAPRADLIPHRRRAFDAGMSLNIPVTSPTQTLRDADLAPHELYRALEEAHERGHHPTLPLNAVVRLFNRVDGRTRSDAEARFLLLCHDHRLPLPRVNRYLNGILADFHWPAHRLVLEVDGWAFHNQRDQFEEDRRRGLTHEAAGRHVLRASARQVEHQPELVLRALRQTTGW